MQRYTYAGRDDWGYFVKVTDVLEMLEDIRKWPGDTDALVKAYEADLLGIDEEAGEPA